MVVSLIGIIFLVSVFKGKEVEVSYAGNKSIYTINSDFILDGNYFIGKLLESKFKQGTKIIHYVYNPSVELDTPVKVTSSVAGYENISINGRDMKLLHIVQSIENIDDNVNMYVDEKGIMYKGIINMMNLKLELIMI